MAQHQKITATKIPREQDKRITHRESNERLIAPLGTAVINLLVSITKTGAEKQPLCRVLLKSFFGLF